MVRGPSTRSWSIRPAAQQSAAPLRALSVAVVSALVVAITGCAASDLGTSDPVNVATYVPAGEGGNAALLEATVYQVQPCIAVEDSTGTKYVPVFPVGAVDVEGGETSFNGIVLVEGAQVPLAGGAVAAAPDGVQIPNGCAGDLWLVNQE